MSEEQMEYITDDERAGMKPAPTNMEWGKPIRCPKCREVIGRVVRRKQGNYLRREHADGSAEEMVGGTVWCACGGVLEWYVGQEAIDELIYKVTHRRGAVLSKRAGNGQETVQQEGE